MITISYDGFQRKVSDQNWKQLKKMFDASQATRNLLGYYIVHAKSICADNSHKCLWCSLHDQHRGTNSCLHIFNQIVGEKAMQCMHIYDHGILWHPKDDATVRQALKKISDVLVAAKTV
jgi:hypothetical protein